jgi:hypothetical protein
LLEPFEDVGVEADGYQFLCGAFELGELLVCERGDIRVVDFRGVAAFLSPGYGL